MRKAILATLSVALLCLSTTSAQQPSEAPSLVNAAKLRAFMPRLSAEKVKQYIPLLQQGMQEGEINTPERLGAFLAKLAVESGDLMQTSELWDPRENFQLPGNRKPPYSAKNMKDYFEYWYGKRSDLGNETEEDGYTYRGGGFIQLTGKNNYAAAGKALGLDLLGKNADLVRTDPGIAMRVAAWYWRTKGLNRIADRSISGENFALISRRINPHDKDAKIPANLEADRVAKSFRARLLFDDNAPKGQVLDAWQKWADADLEARRRSEKKKSARVDELSAQRGAIDKKLRAVQDKLAELNGQFFQTLASEEDWTKRNDRLQAELMRLKASKKSLDETAARLKGTTNRTAIDTYYRDLRDQDARVDRYLRDFERLADEKLRLDQKLSSVEQQRAQELKNKADLDKQRKQLSDQLRKAQADLAEERRVIHLQEAALDNIADERDRLASPTK